MTIFLLITGLLLLLIGLVGSIVPIIPGPPLSYLGLLMLSFSAYVNFSTEFLVFWAAWTIMVTAADYYLPAYMTRKFGGSRKAVAGSLIGLVVGMLFFGPVGVIAGPFLGALVGELINEKSEGRQAFKAAIGAFLSFFVGTLMKLISCALMLFYAVKALIF